MKNFNWEEFKNQKNNIAVHCKTEEEAKDFCNQMHERGMKWYTGRSYLEITNYSTYDDMMCYANDGMHASIGFYKDYEYEILEWSDYMKKEFTKSDLKPCMVVRLRNNELYLVAEAQCGIILFKDKLRWINIDDENIDNNFNEILFGRNEYDVTEVYGFSQRHIVPNDISTDNRELLWKRVEKSPAQIKLKELEAKQRELADEIAKVRKNL